MKRLTQKYFIVAIIHVRHKSFSATTAMYNNFISLISGIKLSLFARSKCKRKNRKSREILLGEKSYAAHKHFCNQELVTREKL